MSDKLNINIDGKPVSAWPGQMIIQAADEAGVYIPRFCYHKKLSIAANCRMCLVQVGDGEKPLPACATPIADGMQVYTKSKVALDAQKAVMEFLLINHPLDCPICDQGGECELQDIAMGYGRDASYYSEGKRVVKDKSLGPLIATDMTRCIHCTRCVRFGTEVAGVPELGVTNRGEHAEIGTYVESTMESEVSGNVIDVCPVGALTDKPSRFRARAWEMQQRPSIAPHDCLGSNLYVHMRGDDIIRVVPHENESINEVWLSDRDRFSYEGTEHIDRQEQPLIKRDGQWQTCDWQTALEFTTQGLQTILNTHGCGQLAGLISPNATAEEQFLLQKLLRGVGSNNIDHRLQTLDFRDQSAQPLSPSLGLPIEGVSNLTSCLLIGSDIQREQPLLALRFRNMVNQGGTLLGISQHAYKQTMPWTEQCITSNLLEAIDGMADKLSGDRRAIILGAEALHHRQAANIRFAAQALAEKIGASFGVLPFGANSVGAWLTGCVPHRSEVGGEITAGLTVQDAFKQRLKSYVLFGIEPEFDCAHSAQAFDALQQAGFVVSCSAFQTEQLKEYANVILPITPWSETSGTFINIQGDWQSFTAVRKPIGEARPGWKVLRVLGNFLHIDGFDFNSSEDVRTALQDMLQEIKLKETDWQPDDVVKPASGIQRIAPIGMYRGDAIVRRAKSLQDTPINQAIVAMNSKLANQLSVQTDEQVTVKQGEGVVTLSVQIEDGIADDCVYIPAGFQETRSFSGTYGSVEVSKC